MNCDIYAIYLVCPQFKKETQEQHGEMKEPHFNFSFMQSAIDQVMCAQKRFCMGISAPHDELQAEFTGYYGGYVLLQMNASKQYYDAGAHSIIHQHSSADNPGPSGRIIPLRNLDATTCRSQIGLLTPQQMQRIHYAVRAA